MKPLPTLLTAIAALAVSGAAARAESGWTPSADVSARLARGEVYADVQQGAGGSSGVVRAAVDIKAPAAVVWKVMLDCAKAGLMVPSVVSCKVTERDPAGRWDVREHKVKWNLFLPPMRSVFRSDYTPMRRIAFHCTGGDLKSCDGEWRLDPLPGGGVRVIYENTAQAPFAAPSIIFRVAMRRDVPDALVALRREALAAAH
ncbi:MAG: cyclase/dehydrase [Caulobacter sp.]|nr:cyclase/dehydrase [Caulobacter sp.]